MSENTIVIVGAGKVGTALAVLLHKTGYKINGIASRTLKSAQAAAKRLTPSPVVTERASELTPKGEIILITTRDDAIERTCAKISREEGFRNGQTVLHVSGSLPSDILSPAKGQGCVIGSMHPLQSFADVDRAIQTLPGSYFCIEGDPEALRVAKGLAKALNGKIMTIKTEDKPIYHAAAVIASNFFVSIIDMSLRFYESIGIDQKKGLAALLPLIEGSLNNIRALGPVKALTGPIARGDAGVVAHHLKAIYRLIPEFIPVYKELARLNVSVGRRKGTLNEEASRRILDLLKDFPSPIS